MKKTNTLILLISVSLISLTMACGGQQKKHDKNNLSQTETENSTQLQHESAEDLFNRLMESFGSDWMEREADPNLYPDYYGGAFIDNNGKFVVTVTGNREEHKKHLTSVLGTENFSVETVQYSYRQMMQVMDKIDAFLMNSNIPEDHPLITLFAGAYPDVMKNRVKVLLTKVDAPTTRLFQKDVVNSPLVIFEKGEQPDFM